MTSRGHLGMTDPTVTSPRSKPVAGRIKCVVWDLDNTLWDGVLLEQRYVQLRPGVAETLAELDQRGILHSVASRNDPDHAMATLTDLSVADYFLHPQINWGSKSASIAAIAEALNIGLDSVAFIDDQPFEREEISFVHPNVLCLDADSVRALGELEELRPLRITADARQRRFMYRAAINRSTAERAFTGSNDQFLATL